MKPPEEVLKEEYRRWVEENSPGLSSEAVDTVVESWEPEPIALRAMERFADQFHDPVSKKERYTIDYVILASKEEHISEYRIEKILNENNIDKGAVINIIESNSGDIILFYHAEIIPNQD